MPVEEQATDPVVIAFMARIEEALKNILQRLDDGQERMRAHELAIQEQRVQCAGCRRDIESTEDQLKTQYARVTLADQRLEEMGKRVSELEKSNREQSGSSRTWRTAFWVLVGLASIASLFVAVWKH